MGKYLGGIGGRKLALLLCSLLVVGLPATTGPANAAAPAGSVYTQTNTAPSNAVRAWRRAPDGTLTPTGSFATGGSGSPANPPNGFPVLDSQGSVALHRSGRVLFAVNGGSDTVSSFIVRPDSTLQLADQVPSGGRLPNSITSNGIVVYALNVISGTISGYTLNLVTGDLTPIPGSTRSLARPAVPAQISFDTFGRVLTVTERGTDVIETFVLGPDNRPGPPTVHASTGPTPFGFAYTAQNRLVVANLAAGAHGSSSVSSYAVGPRTGAVAPIDLEPTDETLACWVAIPPTGRYAYVTNPGSQSITVLRVELDGTLTLIGSIPAFGLALDVTMDLVGQYLYVLTAQLPPFTASAVRIYRTNLLDGTLTFVGTTPSNLPPGSSGLAAR